MKSKWTFDAMIAANDNLIAMYNAFVDALRKVYPNIPKDFHMTPEEFFATLDEYDAEFGEKGHLDLEDETVGHADIRFDELLATLGFQITEIGEDGEITIKARRNYDA